MEISLDNKQILSKSEIRRNPSGKNIKEQIICKVSDFYKEIAEVEVYSHWLDFALKFRDYKIDNSRIFRGQSNDLQNLKFNFWQIQPNLFRSEYRRITLHEYFQNLIFSSDYITSYRARLKNQLASSNLIDLMAFLQHNGIPTPLVDFTTDPITAMYFAMSKLPIKNPIFPEALFHSVFEINRNTLLEDFRIKELVMNHGIQKHDIIDSFANFRIEINPEDNRYDDAPLLGLCNNISQEYNLINNKLEKQNGEFIFLHLPDRIYLDGRWIKELSLEWLLKILCKRNGLLNKPIILHLIPYKSIIDDVDGVFFPHDLLYTYFKLKGKTGLNLFEDITGFRYDFLFNSFKNYTNVNPVSHDDKKLTEVLRNKGVI